MVEAGGYLGATIGGGQCKALGGAQTRILWRYMPRTSLVGPWPLDTPWGRDWSPSQTRFCGLCLAQRLVHYVHHVLANHRCPS